MTCSGEKGCPVADMMDKITGGGYISGGAVVKIGAGSDATTHHASGSSFRAAIANLEWARCKLRGVQYRGILTTLAGGPRALGVCYLIDAGNSTLHDTLRDLGCDPLMTDGCMIYHTELRRLVNDTISHHGLDIVPLHQFAGDSPTAGTFSADMDKCADELLELSRLCCDLEVYHLRAVQKITEIVESLIAAGHIARVDTRA